MSKTTRLERTEGFHLYGIDYDSRTLLLDTDIDLDSGDAIGVGYVMLSKLLKNLTLLESISNEPVTVLLNTFGGCVYTGMGIYDRLKASPCHITIKVIGSALSMGSVILQAADKRLLYPNSSVMFHAGNGGGYTAGPHEVRNIAEYDLKLSGIADSILYAKINEKRAKDNKALMSKQAFHNMVLKGAYLTANEAVELGLADEIIS